MSKSIKEISECNRSDPRAYQSASERSCKRSASEMLTIAGHVALTSAVISGILHLVLDNFGDRPDLTPFYGWLVPTFLMAAFALYLIGRICR